MVYRVQVLADGWITTKSDKEAYHIRDVEKYYRAYTDTVNFKFLKFSVKRNVTGILTLTFNYDPRLI